MRLFPILLLSVICWGSASLQAAETAPKPPPTGPTPPKPAPKPDPEPKPQPAPAPAPAPTPAPATPPATAATEKKKETSPEPEKAAVDPKKKKTVAEVVKDHQRIGGLFDLFMDREKGTIHLYIRKDQFGPEFIYFTHTVDAVVQTGSSRGQYGDNIIFRVTQFFDRVEFVKENTAFYFDPQSPLARASKANVSHAILASEPIVAQDANGVLINASNLFLKESLLLVKPPTSDPSKALLGKLSETKTKAVAIRGYPDNSVVTVEYVYENPSPTWNKEGKIKAPEITDTRYVSLRIQHNLIRMPVNDYKPRFDDPRIGYFTTQVTDLTSTSVTPFRDVIHRWHLVKQKPGTELSEPVQPIVFWMENTTPVEHRDTIRTAALRWNEAFATAGFKDALVIKQQPDNATWDAGDINYNVLRWTSSPNPPFGGYGPSFVNPRTGQILGADIMLEFSFLSKRLRSQHIFTELGLASPQEEEFAAMTRDPRLCLEGRFAQQGILFGQTSLRLRGAAPIEAKEMTKDALIKLILHELGHTLGLNHNFRASYLYDATTIHKKEITSKTGVLGSVMEYAPANLAPDGTPQGEYYTTKPGTYDHWAIEYGYSEALENPQDEKKRLDKITGRSHEPQLAFANDADDMRYVGEGVDPRAMINDMSSDPVAYGIQRCELVKPRLADLLKKDVTNGESWQALTQDYVILTTEAANAMVAISRYVGGVYVERAFAGQAPDKKPYTPVEKDKQVAALNALAKYAFAPDAWALPADLAAHLQQQRRGFDFFKTEETPKLHERIITLQRSLLDQLLHQDTHRRILDSALYGNELPLGQVMTSITEGVFGGDPATGPTSVRQNLQSDYVDRLLRIVNTSTYMPAAQAVAFSELAGIRQRLGTPAFQAVPAHSAFLAYKIKRGLDEN